LETDAAGTGLVGAAGDAKNRNRTRRPRKNPTVTGMLLPARAASQALFCGLFGRGRSEETDRSPGLNTSTGYTLLAKLESNLSKFPSAKHFVS
jgi:hypothetical protein